MEIRGHKTIIRPLELEHVFRMRLWGFHENPLIADYNFPLMTDEEIEEWYEKKSGRWNNKYFGIFDLYENFIGYLGIKDIRLIRKESYLGLVFDPNFCSKGYGSDALRSFLKYYFSDLGMKRMYLEVAQFNKRAYRLYENMGFKPDGYYLDEFFDQRLDLKNTYYLEAESSFVINRNKIYNYVYRMKLEKDDFK
ncbi:GNAT family N-acetyltransferase [Tissierella creatinini]|nr:GNAT family N-acetyltransferase [Tissierella creatinini]TJX62541.1 GNAT family N-acetyltransferase [Soehngenia saccharolytica]